MASPSKSAPRTQGPVQLSVRRSSRVVPIVLLLLTAVLFISNALPSGFKQLALELGLIQSLSDPLTLELVQEKLSVEGATEQLWERVQNKGWSPWEYAANLGRPVVKIFVDQLTDDFIEIARSTFTTIWQLSLYALIPGLAGLIYRRSFLTWFLAAFALLLGINASGVFGRLTTADVMPWSGAILFFILSQLALLLVAYRLRRHVQSASFALPPRVHNWGLTAILVLVGVACWQGWGPGYASSTTQPGVKAQQEAPAAPAVGTQTTEPGSAASEPAAAPAAPAPEAAPEAPVAAGPTRSWIWSFLGDGLLGWLYKWEFILIGLPLIHTLLRNSSNWTARTSKNIVICLDGTSNTPDQLEMGFAAQTNVFKLFGMLKSDAKGGHAADGSFDASLCKTYKDRQIAYYYAGVGNKYDNDPLLQTLGMATGMGAGEVIERAYLDLVRVYQKGDRVFIFGFSRGAAIARLLARTIDARGAPRWLWTLKLLGKHRRLLSSSRKEPVRIDVLGCWDTVGSFGVAKTIAGINFQQLNMFKDLTVPDNVQRAYHMVALDEQRDSFEPTLMDPDPIRLERIVEVWFAGDHANVGGGWATDSLSDVTLDFLLRHVSSGYATDADPEVRARTAGDESWGLYLTAERKDKAEVAERQGEDAGAVDPDPLGQVRHWFSNLYKYRARTLPLHAVISDTVFDRMTRSMPIYAPSALFKLNDELDAKRDLIEEKVRKLAETSSLSAEELEKVIEYKNRLQLRRWPEYWAEVQEKRKGKLVAPEKALGNADLVRQA